MVVTYRNLGTIYGAQLQVLTFDDVTDRLSRNVGTGRLPFYDA
jgi:hypothetical protein